MGKLTAAGADMAIQVVTATLTAAGQTTPAASFNGAFNLFLAGPFVASIGLEASFDGGATWLPITAMGNAVVLTGPAAETLPGQFETGVLIRARCTTYTSGNIAVRLSQ